MRESPRVATQFVQVADVDDVRPGIPKVVVVDGREIALVNLDGCIHAVDNTCPHQGGPLAEGWLDGPLIACPWHAWCFDVRDGKMTLGDFASIDVFDVAVEGTKIAVAREPRR